jgi:hypothetical protein
MRMNALLYAYGICFVWVCCGPYESMAQSEQSQTLCYGKVVDQDNVPVAQATVYLQVRSDSIVNNKGKSSIRVNSDADGLFCIPMTNGVIDIKSIKKDGYDYISSEKAAVSLTNSENTKGVVATSAKNPVVFRILKKTPPAFLIHSSSKLLFQPDELHVYELSLNGPNPKDKDGFVGAGKNKTGVLRVTAEFDGMKQVGKLRIASIGNNHSLSLGEMSYQAPIEGYSNECVVEVREDTAKQPQKHLYVKTVREGIIQYSRLDIVFSSGKGGLVVEMNIWTNPDGSLNLRYDKDYQGQELLRRQQEAREKGQKDLYLGEPVGENTRSWDFEGMRRQKNDQARRIRGVVEEKANQRQRQTN